MTANPDNIELEFRRNVSEELKLIPDGPERFVVITPVAFTDGDLLPIILRRAGGKWYLTDEGHTFLQLTYELEDADFQQPTRREIIDKTVSGLGLQNRNGELVLPIEDHEYGEALYTFIQAILKIDDVRYLSRERVRSTFLDDFRELIKKTVSPRRMVSYNWHEPQKDPEGLYPVDCKVNGVSRTPLFVFALPSDERVAIAALTLHMFDRWNIPHKSVGIFEDQTKLNPKMVARFTDVCDKPFSNLEIAREQLTRFVPELAES